MNRWIDDGLLCEANWRVEALKRVKDVIQAGMDILFPAVIPELQTKCLEKFKEEIDWYLWTNAFTKTQRNEVQEFITDAANAALLKAQKPPGAE